MWELIDFTTEYVDLGYCIETEKRYKVRNKESGQIRILDWYEYENFKELGLIK